MTVKSVSEYACLQQSSYEPLQTAQICDRKNLQIVERTLTLWQSIVEKRINSISENTRTILDSSLFHILRLQKEATAVEEQNPIIIAYDRHGRIHGIAKMTLFSHRARIDSICTAPFNICRQEGEYTSSDDENMYRRGAGTCIMFHIAKMIVNHHPGTSLELIANYYTCNFFKKLGFQKEKSASKIFSRYIMHMPFERVKNLCHERSYAQNAQESISHTFEKIWISRKAAL